MSESKDQTEWISRCFQRRWWLVLLVAVLIGIVLPFFYQPWSGNLFSRSIAIGAATFGVSLIGFLFFLIGVVSNRRGWFYYRFIPIRSGWYWWSPGSVLIAAGILMACIVWGFGALSMLQAIAHHDRRKGISAEEDYQTSLKRHKQLQAEIELMKKGKN